MAKTVRIFGRSIPIAALLLGVMAVAAFAWAAYVYLGNISVSTAGPTSPTWTPQGSWACTLASGKNTGAAITKCGATESGGPDVAISGLSEDNLDFTVQRQFQNATPTTQCIGVVSGTVPPKLTMTWVGAHDAGPSPDSRTVALRFVGSGLLPGETITMPDLVIGSIACP